MFRTFLFTLFAIGIIGGGILYIGWCRWLVAGAMNFTSDINRELEFRSYEFTEVAVFPAPAGQVEPVEHSNPHVKCEARLMVITGYAPLDPKAKAGVCYSGDPNVTASGTKTTPMRTIAASKSIPFGTVVFIEGFKEAFVVEDRGGRIKDGMIDICFASQKEALEFGRQKRHAIFVTNCMCEVGA